jgi:CRISPR/Cas system-associated exonuclease Cas4 (RecB family)
MASTNYRITAWSFSRLQDYRKCPRFAYYKHCLKLKEPGNDAMARGTRIDDMVSGYIAGREKKLPPEGQAFAAEFAELRKRKATVQEQWAFNAQWDPVDWFASNAWLRIKTDVYSVDKDGVMLLVDNKTGKERHEHDEQLSLYAMGALARRPELKAVDVRIWYLDSGLEKPDKEKLHTHKELPGLKKYWLGEIKQMLNDKRFPERPSAACNWCHFRKSNNGPCKY